MHRPRVGAAILEQLNGSSAMIKKRDIPRTFYATGRCDDPRSPSGSWLRYGYPGVPKPRRSDLVPLEDGLELGIAAGSADLVELHPRGGESVNWFVL